MSNRKPVKLNRSDYARVLITETLPYETPLIFSGDGLYDRVKQIGASSLQDAVVRMLVFGETGPVVHSTIPFHYKVRKNASEFRRLGLVHPHSQWKVKEFYEKYQTLILHHCSPSPISIRAPQKIAGSFFRKSAWEEINRYKTGNVTLLSLDELAKHSPSYFSYRGHDRLYKFYESRDFFDLEKNFETLWTLDVSKCFDSIYTHCLSWAVKDKEFTKKYVSVDATFAQEFDALMRHGNHNETNGIVIGPEVSRVFAEIIFQEIDLRVIQKLKEGEKYEHGREYVVRRYVDDVFIFAKKPEVAKEVYECYADTLTQFNLHANTAKSLRTQRPFATSKSRLINSAKREVNSFIDKFLISNDDNTILRPKRIRSTWQLTRSFTDTIRSLCSYNSIQYDEVASFLIAVLAERVKKLVNGKPDSKNEKSPKLYLDALMVLIDALYFLYGVAPAVGGSYKLCTSIVLAMRFTRRYLPANSETIAQKIYELTVCHLAEERQSSARTIDGFLPLETLNVLIASQELGAHYFLPSHVVEALFDGDLGYFHIICCLFYIKDEPQYSGLQQKVLARIEEKLADLSDVMMKAEKAFLLLDMLSCPYLPLTSKRKWMRALFTAAKTAVPPKAEVAAFLAAATSQQWQVSWTGVDLLNVLERKELKQVYS